MISGIPCPICNKHFWPRSREKKQTSSYHGYDCKECGSIFYIPREVEETIMRNIAHTHGRVKSGPESSGQAPRGSAGQGKDKINKWTEEEVDILMEMYNQGKSYDEISKKLNRSNLACSTMVHNCKCGIDIVSTNLRRRIR